MGWLDNCTFLSDYEGFHTADCILVIPLPYTGFLSMKASGHNPYASRKIVL